MSIPSSNQVVKIEEKEIIFQLNEAENQQHSNIILNTDIEKRMIINLDAINSLTMHPNLNQIRINYKQLEFDKIKKNISAYKNPIANIKSLSGLAIWKTTTEALYLCYLGSFNATNKLNIYFYIIYYLFYISISIF